MTKKIIFLSYRRGDSPGYVKSLEKELEHHYGEGSVFRDVKDIAGGTKWKQVIEENLSNAAVLLLIIGPRWDSIWNERINDEVNYVEYELNYANDLSVPVIPITLGGSTISVDTDLKSVSWLRENQQYDMSDKQGRWENDFNGLIKLLENAKDIDKVKRVTQVRPETTQSIIDSESTNNLASRWSRLGASIIDNLIIMVITFPIMLLLKLLTGDFDDGNQDVYQPSTSNILVISVVSIVFFLLINGYVLIRDGQTLGKKVLGIKTVELDNGHADVSTLAKRYGFIWFISLIPVVNVFIYLVNILFIFTKSKRCLHDLVAGTKVIKVNS